MDRRGADLMDMMPGAEAYSLPGEPGLGCLLIHGFTSSPSETRPVAEALQAVGIGSLAPRLPGHGTSPRRPRALRSAELARSRRACTLGAAGAARAGGHLRSLHGRDDGSQSSGPACPGKIVRGSDHRRTSAHDWRRLSTQRDCSASSTMAKLGEPDIRGTPIRWSEHIGYRSAPFRSTVEMFAWWRRRISLAVIRAPLLVIQSRLDHTVLPINARWMLERVGSANRQLLWLKN